MFGCVVAVREDALAGDGIGTPGRPVQYSTPVFWDVPKRAPACGSAIGDGRGDGGSAGGGVGGGSASGKTSAGVAPATAASRARLARGWWERGRGGAPARRARAAPPTGTRGASRSTRPEVP